MIATTNLSSSHQPEDVVSDYAYDNSSPKRMGRRNVLPERVDGTGNRKLVHFRRISGRRFFEGLSSARPCRRDAVERGRGGVSGETSDVAGFSDLHLSVRHLFSTTPS